MKLILTFFRGSLVVPSARDGRFGAQICRDVRICMDHTAVDLVKAREVECRCCCCCCALYCSIRRSVDVAP